MYGDNKPGFKPFPMSGISSFKLNGLINSWIMQKAKSMMHPTIVVICFSLSSSEYHLLSRFIDRIVAQAHSNKVPSLPAQTPANLYPKDKFSAE